MNSSDKKVRHIEATKNTLTLYDDVKYYLLLQVPEGRLVSDKEIQKFLCNKFDVCFVGFAQHFERSIVKGYICRILDYVPMHRELSSGGYILKNYYVEPLKKEGFETEEIKGRYLPRVKNFKKYLFDFERETDIDVDTLKKINSEGLFDVLPEAYEF